MLRSLLLTALFVAAAAYREEMLSSNRITEEKSLGNSCDECKSVTKAIIDSLDDPTRLEELKILLSTLCSATHYETECKLLVKNIDSFLKRIEPFLPKDPEGICKKIHLCTPKMAMYFRLGKLYSKAQESNDLVCSECQMALTEVKKFVDDKATQASVKNFISQNVCKLLPKAYTGTCDLLLEEFLPEVWTSLDAVLANPKAACADIGFCPKVSMVRSKVIAKQTLATFFNKSPYLILPSGEQLTMSCFECKVVFDGLKYDLLNPESDVAWANLLRDFVCPFMPDYLRDGCEDFLNMYAPTVVYLTGPQIDSEKVCADIDICDSVSASSLSLVTPEIIESKKCEVCRILTAFLDIEMRQPEFASDLASGVISRFCPYTGNFNNLCENLMMTYVPVFVRRVTLLLEAGKVCTELAHAC